MGGRELGDLETFQLETAAAARAKHRIGTLIIQQPSFPLQCNFLCIKYPETSSSFRPTLALASSLVASLHWIGW